MSRTFRSVCAVPVGSVRTPGDKSISHRALLLAAAASGTSHLARILDSADVRSTLGAIVSLGASCKVAPSDDGALDVTVTGWGESGPVAPDSPIDCGNSGTTTRLLLGLLAGYDVKATLIGDPSLSKRPMLRVCEPLSRMGATFETTDGHLPITVRGTATPQAISYETPVASAQVKTAILLAGLHADGATLVTEPCRSRDHTERMLPAFGVAVTSSGLTASVEGPATLHAHDLTVPGDPSSAAFPLVAAAITDGGHVTAQGISLNPTRTGFLTVMRRMGAHIIFRETRRMGEERVGDVTVIGDAALTGTIVPAEEIPSLIDEIPLLALLATFADTNTRFSEVGELRVKESDRLAAIVEGLDALGCRAYAEGDDLVVRSGAPTHDATIPTYHDHRLALTWALAGMCTVADVTVDDFECCRVSYPDFYDDMMHLTNREGTHS